MGSIQKFSIYFRFMLNYSRTKLHIGRNPIPWIPKDTGISPVEYNDGIAEEARIIEEIIQENVDHSDDRDYTPMEIDTRTDFQVGIAEITKNDTNEEVPIIMTTRKKYPSGKELFCNFGDDFADDDEWLINGNPFPLFFDNYSQGEVGIKAKKQKEKQQKKSASKKMFNEDELTEIEKLKKENLRLKKLIQRKRKQKMSLLCCNVAILKLEKKERLQTQCK
ncbi:hypothetical protein RF55_13074 [Lasius niger]|uniref:Uncharacterized protein n=1 Tax=Lasius niger TaxID=67767 RepID=A0A0J7KBF1_LASNI|nr:hypothetical protein RF55_13074 [Lasius niger]